MMHVRCPDRLPEEAYRQVLGQLDGLSPVVQALPPTAARVELKGALRTTAWIPAGWERCCACAPCLVSGSM
ncbi:conserved hypothetical protein [Streptomyces sp. e14]|nr:conserved hypothetical protein [Streptomyces sp. e14]